MDDDEIFDISTEQHLKIVENGEFNLRPVDFEMMKVLTTEGLNFSQIIDTIKTKYQYLWSYKTTFIFLMHNGCDEFFEEFNKFLDNKDINSDEDIENWIQDNSHFELTEIWKDLPSTFEEEEKYYNE